MLFVASCTNTGGSGQSNADADTQNAVIEVAVFNVSGMHCEGCENAIINSLTAMDGVTEASATFEDQQATVTFDPSKVSMEAMKTAIEGKGYSVIDFEIIEDSK
jgi:copper chaperone CopZ